MRKPFTHFAALLYCLFSIGQLAAQTPTPGTLVKAGRLLDPRTGEVLSPAAVLIQEHKIVEVGPDPLADIGELERVRFVMKDGQVVRNDLALH
jgi:hypothetical protein